MAKETTTTDAVSKLTSLTHTITTRYRIDTKAIPAEQLGEVIAIILPMAELQRFVGRVHKVVTSHKGRIPVSPALQSVIDMAAKERMIFGS